LIWLLLSDPAKVKSAMDPSFRWDDVKVIRGIALNGVKKRQTRLSAGLLVRRWIPAFAGMT
jgi:hypothetical protein